MNQKVLGKNYQGNKSLISESSYTKIILSKNSVNNKSAVVTGIGNSINLDEVIDLNSINWIGKISSNSVVGYTVTKLDAAEFQFLRLHLQRRSQIHY